MTKTCSKCKRPLPIDEFGVKKRRPGQLPGRNARCKTCARELARIAYHKPHQSNTAKHVCKPGHKICTICKRELPFSAFFKGCKNPTSAWHYDYRCKECAPAAGRRHKASGYKRPSDVSRAGFILRNKWRHVSGGYLITPHKSIKFIVKLCDIENLIELQTTDALRCASSGVELVFDPKHPFRPSLDRINSNFGYEPGNVRICSLFYNLLRNEWSDEEVAKALSCQPVSGIDNAIQAYIARHNENTSNGIYTNPGSGRSHTSTITGDDLKALAMLQTRDGVKCALTGINISDVHGTPAYMSIDRIDYRFGYIPQNVRIAAKMANLAKNRLDDETFTRCWKLTTDGLKLSTDDRS